MDIGRVLLQEEALHTADKEKRDLHRALYVSMECPHRSQRTLTPARHDLRANLEQNSRAALDTLDAELKARDETLASTVCKHTFSHICLWCSSNINAVWPIRRRNWQGWRRTTGCCLLTCRRR